MRIKIISILLILMFPGSLCFNLFSQKSKTDSLFVELKKAKEDTVKVNLLADLSWLLRKTFPDSAQNYVKIGLKLSEHLKFKKGEATLYKTMGSINWNRGNYKEAKDYYNKSLSVFKELKESNNISTQLFGYNGIASCNNGLGLISYHTGKYNLAIEFYLKSIKTYEEIDDIKGVANCYNNIGMVHWKQENYDRAIKYYEKSLQIFNEIDHKEGMISGYNNIAIIYKMQKKYSKALDNYQKSLEISQELNNMKSIAQSYNNIGMLYTELGEYKLALNNYQKALELKIIIDDKNGITTTLGNLAGLNNIEAKLSKNNIERNKKFNKAIKYSEEGLAIAKEIGAPYSEMTIYKTISESFKGINQFEKSLESLNLHLQLKDSLFNKEKNEQIEEMEAKYQAEKNLLEIETLEKENELKAFELERMNIRQILSYVIIFVFVLLIISLIIIRKRLRKKNKIIFEQNKTITSQIKKNLTQNEEILTQRDELDKYSKNLEKLIKERTHELTLSKEKAEESDRLKSEFFANMSHEIRTPMNAIVGFSELLTKKNIKNEKKEELISNISNSCDSLLLLIDNIIDVSKIESNQFNIINEKFLINNLFNELITFYNFKKYPNFKNIEIKIKNLVEENHMLYSDYSRLRQVMYKLINNATKFTEKGSIEVGYYLNKTDDVIFYVKDTGIGMSNEQLDKIFKRFTTLESERKKLYRGAGLGLYISKRIIELLGGRIWVDSEVNIGSSFYFSIPYNKHIQTRIKE